VLLVSTDVWESFMNNHGVYICLLTMLYFKQKFTCFFSGLTCDWTSGVGRLDPYITSGSIKSLSVTSEDV